MNNELRVIGRLTHDPEKKITATGTLIVSIDLAIDMGKDKDGNKKSTFLPITYFGKTAEVIDTHCRKGDQVLCGCEVANNNYTDKSGKQIYGYRFNGRQVSFLNKAKREVEEVKKEPVKEDPFADFGANIDDNFLE